MGWSTDLKFLRASFAAPRIPTAVDCLAGPADSDFSCGAAQIDHAGLTRFSQQNLLAGQRMTATVELLYGHRPGEREAGSGQDPRGRVRPHRPGRLGLGGLRRAAAGRGRVRLARAPS